MIVPLVCEAAAFPSRQPAFQPARVPAGASQTKCSTAGSVTIAPAFAAIFAMLHREVIRAPHAVPLLLE
jgi:hypothetical protein